MSGNDLINALEASIIANRKDQVGQTAWTEWRTGLVVTGGASSVGSIPLVSSTGKLDPSLVPGGTGTDLFSALVGGVNNDGQIMIVGSTSQLTFSGTGIINASEVGGIDVSGNAPAHAGQLLISQPGNARALWADPFVQGPWVDGTLVIGPGAMGDGTSNIQPVLVGGKGSDGKMHSLPLFGSGQALETIPNLQLQSVSGTVDGYQRLRVASPVTILDLDYAYYMPGDLIAQQIPIFSSFITGSGAVVRPAFEPAAMLSVGTDSGAQVIWQTKESFPAQVGKGLHVIQFGMLGANVPNVIKRIGFYDNAGGWFFEQNGQTGTLRVATRTSLTGSPVDTAFDQSTWNIDKMDGTGPSGITLDPTKYQVFVIDTGALRVRFGLYQNGILYYVHQNVGTNFIPAVFTAAGDFPVRAEVLNTSASAGAVMKVANAAVVIDGGFEDNPSSFAFSVNTGDTLKTGITTPVPILSIRPRLLVGTQPNRTFITLRDFGVFTFGQVTRYQLVYNGTLTGASFNPADPQAAVEFDTTATGITGGRVVDSGYIAAFAKDVAFSADKFPFRLPFTLDYSGSVQDVYTLVVSGVNGSSTTVGGSFKWQEIR